MRTVRGERDRQNINDGRFARTVRANEEVHIALEVELDGAPSP